MLYPRSLDPNDSFGSKKQSFSKNPDEGDNDVVIIHEKGKRRRACGTGFVVRKERDEDIELVVALVFSFAPRYMIQLTWNRKLIVKKRRASLDDFDRFKIMLAKIKKAGVVWQELAKHKKEITA
ncbi:hypothetical protein Bca52824_016111 [Brassica carinata]|uniref:Large ribosomal subunit protein eL14 domain-containing protein n=1 Tax=Brassica carinata TaxID=52824 RepID=A0A8X8B621_BRACI|nr:hypothetical protein Bca52824_016111 [Brassica carinata]